METLHPGLYLQEIKGEVPVEGESTSTGAFVGTAQKGEIGKANLVTSWAEFVKLYGGFDVNSYLAYAVRGFFENGGTRAFISRVVKSDNGINASKSATVSIGGVTPYLEVSAKTDGTWGNDLSVEIANVSITTPKTFDFYVKEKGVVVEQFLKTTLDNLELVASEYVAILTIDGAVAPVAGVSQLATGDNGILGIIGTDYIGDAVRKTGLHAFNGEKINLIAVPGITDSAVAKSIESYVDGRKDCFAILEVPMAKTALEAKAYKTTEANLSSPNVALYYSWGKISDPIGVGTNPTKLVPPSGHIMGVFARTDNDRGVYKAPAGVDAVVRGFIGLERSVGDAEQDILNPEGVNCIRAFAGEGIILWGARTTQTNGDFTYIPVRRSLIFINQSILGSTRWAVFEPNDTKLWGKLKTAIEGFLRGFWNAGGLKGNTEEQAFFVQVDDSTTSQADIALGKVNAHYGVSPQKPAEFIVFKVSLRK